LAEFLEHHCDLDVTASALGIHRSTLRYRLFRIRELTGYDIQMNITTGKVTATAPLTIPAEASGPPASTTSTATEML
jgi:hypothetical protein